MCYLAEWYCCALTPSAVDDLVRQLTSPPQPSLPLAARVIALIAAPADEVLYGVFVAAEPSAVTRLCRSAGLPLQRLTPGVDARILTMTLPPDPSEVGLPEGSNPASLAFGLNATTDPPLS